jgi:hypothetical protein
MKGQTPKKALKYDSQISPRTIYRYARSGASDCRKRPRPIRFFYSPCPRRLGQYKCGGNSAQRRGDYVERGTAIGLHDALRQNDLDRYQCGPLDNYSDVAKSVSRLSIPRCVGRRRKQNSASKLITVVNPCRNTFNQQHWELRISCRKDGCALRELQVDDSPAYARSYDRHVRARFSRSRPSCRQRFSTTRLQWEKHRRHLPD